MQSGSSNLLNPLRATNGGPDSLVGTARPLQQLSAPPIPAAEIRSRKIKKNVISHNETRKPNHSIQSAAFKTLKISRCCVRVAALFLLDYSHYVPIVPVAANLASRGHTVSFHCANHTWKKVESTLKPAGVTWIPIQ